MVSGFNLSLKELTQSESEPLEPEACFKISLAFVLRNSLGREPVGSKRRHLRCSSGAPFMGGKGNRRRTTRGQRSSERRLPGIY